MLNWTNDIPEGTKQSFDEILSMLPINCKILEIGAYAGTSVVQMLKQTDNSHATVIDTWTNYYEYDQVINKQTVVNNAEEIEKEFFMNIKDYQDRVKTLKGKSCDKLVELLLNNSSFHFIYIDGSHKSMDVYLDAVLSWKMLKIGGILAFDDYKFNRGDDFNSPYEAIEHFKNNYLGNFVILKEDYRLYLKKIN
jgi:predicted O-methyltransferase YrrM